VWLLGVGAAGAQSNGAAAEAMFQKGVADMEKKDFAAACPALSESQRLDPRPGTLFTLAECEAGWGHLASAFTGYTDYVTQVDGMPPAQRSKHADRRGRAAEQLKKLETQVPRVTLKTTRALPAGTEITLDALKIGGPMLGVPLPLDPGEHTITTRLGSSSPQSQMFSVVVGERKTVEIQPPKEDSGTPVAPTTSAAPATTTSPTSPPTAIQAAPPPSHTAIYVAGGVGAVGLIVGGVTGGLALGKKSTITDNCTGLICNHTGKEAADSAKSMALLSTIGFGVGIAGVGLAAVLYATSSPASPQSTAWRLEPAVGKGSGGLSFAGQW
jgi:hypothetical protein